MKLQANSSNGAAALARYRMILNSVKRQHPRMSPESARAKAKKLYAMYKRKLPAYSTRLGGKKMLADSIVSHEFSDPFMRYKVMFGGIGEDGDEIDMGPGEPGEPGYVYMKPAGEAEEGYVDEEPAEEEYVDMDPEEEAEVDMVPEEEEYVDPEEEAKMFKDRAKKFMAELKPKQPKKSVDKMMMDAMNARLKELNNKVKAKQLSKPKKSAAQPSKYSPATMAAIGKLMQEVKKKNAKKQLAALPSKQPSKYSPATMAAIGKLMQDVKKKNAKKLPSKKPVKWTYSLPPKKKLPSKKLKPLSADKLKKQLAMCDSSRQAAVHDLAKTAMKLKLSAKELSVIKKSLNKSVPSRGL